MRVLYFHQHFSTRAGSTGTRSYEFARKLIERGNHVTMVCGSAAIAATGLEGSFAKGVRRGKVDDIEVIELEVRYSNRQGLVARTIAFLRFALRSSWIALREPCDVVFATSTPLTAGIPGIAAALLRRRPFVFEVRDLWPELPKAMGLVTNPVVLALMSMLEWLSYRCAISCVALSPGIAEGIRRRGKAPDRVRIIPNGCDLDLFGGSRTAARRPPEVGAGDLLAIFPGAHGIANGLDSVLDAATILQARGRRDVKIVLVGDGMTKPHLVDRARRERIENVVFLDPLRKTELSALMASADVGLMILKNVPAFYYGTSPNKFFDYIAAGLPVLTNYPGWLASLIDEHHCGLAVPPDNPDAFASALASMADDRAKLALMGKRARALAESQFDRDRLAEDFAATLSRAVALHGGKAHGV